MRSCQLILVATLVLLATAQQTYAGVQQTYYVSPTGNDNNPGTQSLPFQHIEKARDQVRQIRAGMTGDIVVYLRSGRYELTNTINFTQADGGTNGYNVMYSSYPGERASISGGKVIRGWVQVAQGVYKASLGGDFARQLYINGKRGTRARVPNVWPINVGYTILGADEANQRIMVATKDLNGWETSLSTGQVEILMNVTFWQDINFVTSMAPASDTETWLYLRNAAVSWERMVGHPYYLQNSMDYLDAQGEWHIDKSSSEVYYKPRNGEDMRTAVVYLPMVRELMHLEGTASSPIANLQFKGLRFEHSTFLEPESTGFSKGFSSSYMANGGWNDFPGAIQIVYAQRVVFERNIFRHLGGGGLMAFGMQNSSIVGNVFTDVAAYGIYLRSPGQGNTDVRNVCKDDHIENNYIYGIGTDYNANHGIDVYSTDGVVFSHNELENLPQGGLSLTRMINETAVKDNVVQFNKIHDLVKVMRDYGGVYVWGYQPNSRIFENYIYNAKDMFGDAPGIYLDEGYDDRHCTGFTVENNVLENNDVDLYLHVAQDNVIINFNGSLWDGGLPNQFMQNGTLDKAAVKANSGIESSYTDIKNLVYEDSNGGLRGKMSPPKNLQMIPGK